MTAWTPVRVVREIDGVVYDSETANVVHHWNETIFYKPYRMVLATNPDGYYFLTDLSEGTILRPDPKARVDALDRKASIGVLADAGAPDSVLEGLGVEIITPTCDDKRHGDIRIIATSDIRFGEQTLAKTSCGHFWMFRTRGIFGKKRWRVWEVSQHEAIAWGLRKGAGFDSARLALLGIRDDVAER